MGRLLFKVILIAILGCVAYVMIHFVITTFGNNISNTGTAFKGEEESVSANVSNVSIEHNVTNDGKVGMIVSIRKSFKNLEGIDCYTMIRFYDDAGNPLKGKSYKDDNGDFCMIGTMIPDDNDCECEQTVFVSYDQFDVPESKTVYFLCDVCIFIINGLGESVELASSNPSRFHLSY